MSYWWLKLAKAFEGKATQLRERHKYKEAEMMAHIAEVFKELAQ